MAIGDFPLLSHHAYPVRVPVPDYPYPLSQLAAIIGDGYVLAGSDGRSRWRETGFPEPPPGHSRSTLVLYDKVRPVDGQHIVWGSVGTTGHAGDISAWLAENDATTWTAFVEQASLMVCAVNRDIRTKYAASAGPLAMNAPPEAMPSVQLLVAGYVGGVPGVASFDERGETTLVQDGIPLFVGPLSGTCRVAAATLGRLAPDISLADPATFHSFLFGVIDADELLHLPAVVWKCTAAEPPQSLEFQRPL